MAIKEVFMLGNPLLREKSLEIKDFNNEIPTMVKDLKDTLTDLQKIKRTGRALAAPQIGYLKRVIYMQTDKRKLVMINPTIIWKSEETVQVWDDCFSFDMAFLVKITRHKKIKIKYQNESEKIIIEEFEGDFSELFQHEIDHLDGILAIDHLSNSKNIVMKSEWGKIR